MYQLGILEPDEDYKEFLVTEKSIYAKKNGIVVYKDLIDGVSVNVLRNTKEDIDLDEFRRVHGILDESRQQSFAESYPEWRKYA